MGGDTGQALTEILILVKRARTQWSPQRTNSALRVHPTLLGPVGSWDILGLVGICDPITSNGILGPGDPAARCGWWMVGEEGAQSIAPPPRTCTKGFPLEESVFNDCKGTGV